MSESLRDLVVSLSLQTDNFTRNIKSVNKQIKEAESNFKLASAGVENFEQTASGLSSHLSTLERKLTLQRQVVTQYEQALQAANSKLSECYNRQNDYAKRLEQARAAQASLKEQVREAAAQVREYTRTLGESDAATENARGALDSLKAEYLEAVQNVRKLAGQNTALQKSTLNAADAVTTARTNLNNASAAVRITETDIQKCNTALALAETNWEQATQAIKAGESALSAIGQQIRLAESNFTLAAASIENVETSVDGLSARMIMLEERYRLQTKAVTQYQNILESTKEQLEAAAAANDPAKVEEATRAVTEAQIALNHAQSAVEKTKLELEDCNQALALANTQWYSAGEAFSKAETAIARIGQQIQLTESEFRLAVVGMKDVESSTDGLGKKADMLSTKWLHLMDVVSQSQKALNVAYDRLAAANEAGDSDLIEKAEADVIKARTALNNARAASEEAYFELQRCRNELDLFSDGWYDAGDSIEKSKSALGAINKQLQQAQSRFKIASAGIKDIDKSAQGLSAKLTLLKEKFDLQKKALQQYEYALSAAQIRLEIAQNANDPEKIQKAADEVLEAETALIGATAALKETEAEIEACNRALKTAQSAWTAAGNSLESFSKTCDKVSKGMTTAGRTLTTVMTAPIIALGTAAVKASISYETAFTSVRKTVDATEAEFARLSGEIKQMSTEVATSADDIAEVVAIAGQLGIANEYLTSFSKTMIDLGNSTDIVAEEAASTLAKFANITGMDQSQFSNLGATLVDLGNNYATTESAIMNMAMRLAAAGDQVGLSESQILGFAAALSSVGIEAEMGGSAFSKALIKMEVAAATGGQALEDFAMVSGMTADQFKALWDADPAGAFQAFIEGLAKMDDEGMSAIATLDEIGIAEIRLRDTLLRAVNANELFTETQITANKAWEENTALVEEAGKRYATTSSKLTNLKNKAVLFGQQIGDDLNPTIHELIDGVDELLEKFMALDEAQRLQIIKFAAIAAASGPVLLGLGKISKGISVVTSGLSTFAKAVGKAGGGFKGFASVLAKSPAFWVAIAAAAVTATVAIVDFVSGARQAREALEGMNETAEKWKQTAADTFYSNSDGLSFFGLSESDFTRTEQTAAEWLSGLLSVWTDGQKETDQIVSDWTESFKALTGATREELEEMKATADAAGYTTVSDGIAADIATLDALDAEIETLLKKRQNGYFTEADQIRLQELIDTREAIEIKYKLSPADTDGFDTIQQRIDAEVARAQARGQSDADPIVYENAMVASAEGFAAVNAEIDAQYDKEYELIQLIEDAGERQLALDALNARYNADRRAAALEYAQLMSGIVMPVWDQANIQQAASDIDLLMQKLREYSAAKPEDKPAILEEINAISAGMDEGSLTEYVALLMQIQSLLDSGMGEEEIQAMFPEIDFSTALDQIAAIQEFLTNRETELPGLASMFGEALPEEILTIATDLDMTGAQARWDEFAANPGAITTDAIIASYDDQQALLVLQPQVDAYISKFTEIPEGADTASLTPTGMVAYVTTYAEVTTGADVSGLNPTNVVAMVSAYDELASGTDISLLHPDEITAYVMEYCEANGVDISGLAPEGVTAFVMAYEEITGGAVTSALTPSDVTAMVCKYLEAEGIDISALSPDQVEAIVSAYAEATGCDKDALMQDFTATIVAYDDTNAVKPKLNITVSITGYDLAAYNEFVTNNPVEVEGRVRLGEVYENPQDVLSASNAQFYVDGQQVEVSAVPAEQITADTLFVYDTDGTMHVLITPEVQGTPEALEAAEALLHSTEHQGSIGARWLGDDTLKDLERCNEYLEGIDGEMNSWLNVGGWMNRYDRWAASSTFSNYFDPTEIGNIQAYVAEAVAAINSGQQLDETTIANLQSILHMVELLDSIGIGQNVTAGIAEGMTEAGWDTDAETVASNLEAAINLALGIESPAKRMKPAGDQVAAGIGVGMTEHDMSTDAVTLATGLTGAVEAALPPDALSMLGTSAAAGLASALSSYSMGTAGRSVGSNAVASVSSSLNSTSLRSIGVNAMRGLVAGINAGRSGVISAMRSAARAAVNAAKSELQIRSPSAVFEDEVGVQAMRGLGLGVLKESKEQARVVRNAARYLTDEARNAAIVSNSNDNRRTYNQNVSSTIQVDKLYVRDEQDVRSLAVEIATLTRRQQRGKGLRFA